MELLSDFKISHGSAVAIGMVLMAKAAVAADLCDSDVPGHMERMLRQYHLPTSCSFTADALARVALSDKKRKGDSITLVLPDRIGNSRLHTVFADSLSAFLQGGL